MTEIKEHRICVNGSRDLHDAELMAEILDRRIPKGSEKAYRIVSGGARGADSLAENYARKRGIPLSVYRANWEYDGKAAGFIRNKRMLDDADEIISFWDGQSRGTKHAFEYAKSKGLAFHIINYLDCGIPIELCDSKEACITEHESFEKFMIERNLLLKNLAKL